MLIRMVICVCLTLSMAAFFVNCGTTPPTENPTADAGTEKVTTPDTAAPKDEAPKDVAAQDEAPKDVAAQDEAPKDEAPKDVAGCTDGKTDCSGTCVDTKTDAANCGACGTACKAGETCKEGKCEGGGGCDPDPGYTKVQEVWNAGCSCHIGGSSGGLSLKDPSRDTIVDKASSSGKVYIKPGDVAGSYIMDKIEGAAGISGSKMPLGGGALTSEQLGTLKAWICNGAK